MTSALTGAAATGAAFVVAKRGALGTGQFFIVILAGLAVAIFLAWMAAYASSRIFRMRWAARRAPSSWKAFMPMMFFVQFVFLVAGAIVDMRIASWLVAALR